MQVYDLTGIYDLKFRLEVKQESFASFFILGSMLKTALEKQQEKGLTLSPRLPFLSLLGIKVRLGNILHILASY